MKFIDLDSQLKAVTENGKTLRDVINLNITKVLNHTQFICGPEVNQLEEALAKFVNVKHSVGVSSGTDALLIALMAIDLKPGEEVITSPFSFISTVEVILMLKAKPVFVDIDPITFNIDHSKIEEKITKKTKAIIPVSLYGQTADLTSINSLAKKYNIPVIEDAAQSFGAKHQGKYSCSQTTLATTSFFPSKPLGCYGDGGAVFTNDEDLAKRVRKISKHGQDKRYLHSEVGINGRLDTLQAAILLPKLKLFESEIEKRNQVAEAYKNKLIDLSHNIYPKIKTFNSSVYAQYTIRVKNRSKIQAFLSSNGIPTAVHYPLPLNEQEIFNNLIKDQNVYKKLPLENARKASNEVLSLPFSPYLKEEDQNKVVEYLHKAILKFN